MVVFLPETVRVGYGKNEKKLNICLPLVLVLMGCMSALRRYDVGNDTISYKIFFSNIALGYYYEDMRIELGYRYLNILIAKFTQNFTIFLVITSIILFWGLGRYILNNSVDNKLFLWLFWLYGYIVYVSPLRQSIALVIVFSALRFLLKKKLISFYLLIALASTFHLTAVSAIIFPLLIYFKPKSLWIFLAIIGIVILVTSGAIHYVSTSFLNYYYTNYLTVQSGFMAVIFNSAIGFVPLVLAFFSSSREKTWIDNDSYKIYKWSATIYTNLIILSLFSSGTGRLALFFLPMTLSYWCFVIRIFIKRRFLKNLVILILSINIITYQILAMIYRPEWNSFFPLYYIWQ